MLGEALKIQTRRGMGSDLKAVRLLRGELVLKAPQGLALTTSLALLEIPPYKLVLYLSYDKAPSLLSGLCTCCSCSLRCLP